jgi:RNA polymerase sigma factor (sigma-70 family)
MSENRDYYYIAGVICRKYGSSQYLREDAIQEVVMRLWEKTSGDEPIAHLYRIAYLSYVDFIREYFGSNRNKEGRGHKNLLVRLSLEETEEWKSKKRYEYDDNRIQFQQIVGRLDDEDREFLTKYLSGKNLKDLGKELGVSEARASQNLDGIKKALIDFNKDSI